MGILSCAWMKHPEVLEEIVRRHPILAIVVLALGVSRGSSARIWAFAYAINEPTQQRKDLHMAETDTLIGHHDKMCAMTCCPCHLDVEKVKPLVRGARFICKGCGRVAAAEKHLCEPVPLS